MSEKLVVVDDRWSQYRIQWELEEDMGAVLGEGEYRPAQIEKKLAKAKTDEDREHLAACLAAAHSKGVEHDSTGFFWESKSAATAALRLARAQIKACRDNKPWPDWALQAHAEGWRPPRGWKP